MAECELSFSDDLLRGAAAIAEFVFKDRTKRRAVYHLAATTRFPTFKLGAILCARRSEIMKFVAAQELRLPIGVQPSTQT